jgi:tetratricopeptide (TPR) repeat protein
MTARTFSTALPLILGAVVLSAVAGAGAAVFVVAGSASPGPQNSGVEAAGPGDEIGRRVADLARQQERLQRSLEELRLELARRPDVEGAEGRFPVGELDAAVERYLTRRAQGGAAGDGLAADEPAAQPLAGDAREAALEQALAALRDPELDDVARQELWRELAAKGLTGDIVAEFERRAEEDPTNPERKVELGEIYLNKIFEVGNSPLAGVWATKADKAFDAALALDENHWKARFNKAVSLSFWPPVFGKQAEAISHFETLVAQQASTPSEPGFAQTHLLLGNMYQQQGDTEKAIAAWERGLRAFPDDESLRKQIELLRGN